VLFRHNGIFQTVLLQGKADPYYPKQKADHCSDNTTCSDGFLENLFALEIEHSNYPGWKFETDHVTDKTQGLGNKDILSTDEPSYASKGRRRYETNWKTNDGKDRMLFDLLEGGIEHLPLWEEVELLLDGGECRNESFDRSRISPSGFLPWMSRDPYVPSQGRFVVCISIHPSTTFGVG